LNFIDAKLHIFFNMQIYRHFLLKYFINVIKISIK
jgi:hypothetical protein